MRWKRVEMGWTNYVLTDRQTVRQTDRQTDISFVIFTFSHTVHSQALFWITHAQYRFWSNHTLCPCSTDMKRWDKTKQTQDRSVTGTWDEHGLRQDEQISCDRQKDKQSDRQADIHLYVFCIANLYFEHNAFKTNSEATFPCALLLLTSKGRHMRWRGIEMGWICCDRQTNSRTDRQIYMLYLCYLPFHIWYMTYLYFQHKFWGNLTLCPCSTDIKRWDKTKQTQDR